MAWDESVWEDLLYDIEKGSVVPVIGRDLLKVQYQNQEKFFYPLLAQKLAEKLKVSKDDLPEGDEINTVVERFVKEKGRDQLDKIYSKRLPPVMEDLALPTPDPLKKLAEIHHFKLFVTTTIDGLLEQAITDAAATQTGTSTGASAGAGAGSPPVTHRPVGPGCAGRAGGGSSLIGLEQFCRRQGAAPACPGFG